jgi:hypothetical protein
MVSHGLCGISPQRFIKKLKEKNILTLLPKSANFPCFLTKIIYYGWFQCLCCFTRWWVGTKNVHTNPQTVLQSSRETTFSVHCGGIWKVQCSGQSQCQSDAWQCSGNAKKNWIFSKILIGRGYIHGTPEVSLRPRIPWTEARTLVASTDSVDRTPAELDLIHFSHWVIASTDPWIERQNSRCVHGFREPNAGICHCVYGFLGLCKPGILRRSPRSLSTFLFSVFGSAS